MIVNGTSLQLPSPCSVSTFLKSQGYKVARVAVELNKEILPKSQYDSTLLCDTDRIEVVQFMGGG